MTWDGHIPDAARAAMPPSLSGMVVAAAWESDEQTNPDPDPDPEPAPAGGGDTPTSGAGGRQEASE